MNMDVVSDSESVDTGTQMVMDDDDDDGEYVERGAGAVDSDADSEDEQDEAVLYQEFLAARHRAKAKAAQPKKALSKPDVVPKVASVPKRQAKVKTVVNKLELREGITELRAVAPAAAVQPIATASAKKRPNQLSDHETASAKRSKSDSIGGLVANWEKMYQQSAPAASTTSLALSGRGDETEDNNENPPGAFDHDEDVETLKEARKAKGLSKTRNAGVSAGKGVKVDKKTVTVKLELANVNEIDGKEREKAKARKAAWKFEDLPLPSTSDIKLFKSNVIVPILDWAATLEDQFNTNSHSDLKPTVVLLWNNTFSHLPKHLDEVKKELRVDHPAIMAVVQTQIRSHRSELGKAAMATIARNWKHPDLKGCKTAEQRAEWVKIASKNKWFVYDKPENTAADGRGAYLGRLIIQTMAYHIHRTVSTPTTFGPSAGALALAAAAVKRALQVWKKGVNSLAGKQSKNSPESFGEESWAAVVKQHHKNTNVLSKDKWNEIYLRCREFSAGGKGDEGEESDEEEDNESDEVDISD
ncbi:uncharacterized protein ARMOST_17527 [Armillaria ostoyae]|uniref:DUF6532 domain-containing protein n=1 Tax=Armillaria ostoyae TaxID=47428 RepID=A0A284RZ81_ARMOS|nr:uncharacterized protein ARMOST_17527 [Armillaria ostoyae]